MHEHEFYTTTGRNEEEKKKEREWLISTSSRFTTDVSPRRREFTSFNVMAIRLLQSSLLKGISKMELHHEIFSVEFMRIPLQGKKKPAARKISIKDS